MWVSSPRPDQDSFHMRAPILVELKRQTHALTALDMVRPLGYWRARGAGCWYGLHR